MKKAIPNEGNSISTGLAVWRKQLQQRFGVCGEQKEGDEAAEAFEANLGSRRSYTKGALILFHWLWRVTETF